MKKLKTLFSAKKIVIYLTLVLFALTVPQLNQPAKSQTEAIVTMLCLDLEGDKVVTSATILTPGQDKQANQQVFSGEGVTLSEAINNIALSLGKEMSFAQCEIMAMGDTLCDDGIIQSLDYLTRTKKVGRNAVLINFSGDIMDFTQAVVDLSKEKNLKLSDIINYDKRYILAEESNVELFYIGYYSDIGLGIMPQLKIDKVEIPNAIEVGSSSGGSSGSGGSGGGSGDSGQGGNGQKKYLLNNGTTNIFKEGKRELILEPDMVKRLNLFLDIEQKGSVTIEHVTDDLYNDATVVIDLLDKKLSIKSKFKGDIPKFEISTTLTVVVEEVVDNNPTKDMLRRNEEFLTSALVNKIKETIKSDMEEIIAYCKENNVDLVNVYKTFYRKQNKQWKKYIERVGIENYLKNVEFDIKIDVNSQY